LAVPTLLYSQEGVMGRGRERFKPALDQPALGDRAIEAGGENNRAIGFASTAGIFEAALGIVRASLELFEPV
jgi:hypothetical protein